MVPPRGPTGLAADPPTRRFMDAEQLDSWKTWLGDAAAGQRLLALWQGPGRQGLIGRGSAFARLPCSGAKLAVDRRGPGGGAPARSSPIPSGSAVMEGRSWASFELARLYEKQGRVDRALRALRRRWIPMGKPSPRAGLAQALSPGGPACRPGQTTRWVRSARIGITCGCEWIPSHRASPQLDSVRAEIRALGGLEGAGLSP